MPMSTPLEDSSMQTLASSITVPLPEDLCNVMHYPGKDIRIVRLFRQPVRKYKEAMSRGGNKDWSLSCKVYVGELGNNANKQEIEDAFKQYGPLKNVWIARNPPGFAFVEFHDNRDAEDAVKALDGTKMCRKYVRVEMSHGKCRWGRGGPPVSQGRYRDDSMYRPRQSGSRRSRSPRSRSPPPRRGSRYSRSRSRSRSSSPSYRRRDDYYR